jgi:hypothetical protein
MRDAPRTVCRSVKVGTKGVSGDEKSLWKMVVREVDRLFFFKFLDREMP